MNELVVELADGRTAYRPGETLHGRVRWQLDHRPREMEVALFWHTEGKGTTDSRVADRELWEEPGARGEREFAFTLPDAPHSFSGRLISLVWGVEAILKKGKMHAHAAFTLSPTGANIHLPRTEAESNERLPTFLAKFADRFRPS